MHKNPFWAALVTIFSFLVVAGFLSRQFPPVNTDEAFIAVHGFNLMSGQGQRYSLYDDIFAPSAYTARAAFGQISLTLTNAWFGLAGKLSRTYASMRGAAVLAGGLALLVFYGIGNRMGHSHLGLPFVFLLGTDPVFLLSTCLIRPEILILLAGGAVLWLSLAIPETFRWKSFLIGASCGFLFSIHPNSMCFWIGMMVFLWLLSPPEGRVSRGLIFAAGVAAGVVVTLAPVNLPQYVLSYKLMMYDLYKPPVLTSPWFPWRWIYRTAATLFSGQTFYINARLVPGWRAALLWRWIGLLLCLGAGVLYRKRAPLSRMQFAFLSASLVAFVAMSLLISRKEATYFLLIYPFLIPLLGGFISIPKKGGRRPQTLLTAAGAACLGMSLYNTCVFVQRSRQTYKPLDDIAAEVKTFVKNDTWKIVGPNVLWFYWNPDQFRDIGALMYSHWYTGGQRDLPLWLKRWKPDIFITDAWIKHQFFGNVATISRIGSEVPVEYLGTVNAGQGSYGIFEVYRIHWPLHEKFPASN